MKYFCPCGHRTKKKVENAWYASLLRGRILLRDTPKKRLRRSLLVRRLSHGQNNVMIVQGTVFWQSNATSKTRAHTNVDKMVPSSMQTFLSRSVCMFAFRKDMDHYIYRMQQRKRTTQAPGKQRAKVQ